ncbi:uncharacterized protein [Aristolochia californica]|uniref:uncharacterized protein n=1 Tax=Aristolochia californica TaxID=171875 RepID=UPI0035D52F25
MSSTRHLHLVVVWHIIRYQRGSPTRGLFFPTGSALLLVTYSDPDWTRCPIPVTLQQLYGSAVFLLSSSFPRLHLHLSMRIIRVISLLYISSDLQVVDVFTRALSQPWHNFLIGKLFLADSPASI